MVIENPDIAAADLYYDRNEAGPMLDDEDWIGLLDLFWSELSLAKESTVKERAENECPQAWLVWNEFDRA